MLITISMIIKCCFIGKSTKLKNPGWCIIFGVHWQKTTLAVKCENGHFEEFDIDAPKGNSLSENFFDP